MQMGRYSWKTPDGRRRVVQLLDSYGFKLSQPWKNVSYWTKNFHNVTHTHLEVICGTCQYLNHRVTVLNLRKIKPGCFCSGRVRWNDPASRQALSVIVSKSRFSWFECAMEDSWWIANITGESCIMPVCCDVCGLATTATIHNFRARGGDTVGCGCSAERMSMALLETRASSWGWSVVSYEEETTNADSTVTVACNTCNFVALTTCRRLKVSSPSCICSGKVRWSNAQMRMPFVAIVQSTRFEVPTFAHDDAAWTSESLCSKKSIIKLRCSDCGHQSSGFLSNFLVSHSFPCACSGYQTETIFYTALRKLTSHDSRLRIDIQVFVKYEAGGCGFVDAVLNCDNVPILALELDGEQHFRSVDPNSSTLFVTQQRRDRNKEAYCRRTKLPLARFYQPDVWRNRIPWQQILQDTIDNAISSTLPATTYHSNGCVYVCVCQGMNRCAWCV